MVPSMTISRPSSLPVIFSVILISSVARSPTPSWFPSATAFAPPSTLPFSTSSVRHRSTIAETRPLSLPPSSISLSAAVSDDNIDNDTEGADDAEVEDTLTPSSISLSATVSDDNIDNDTEDANAAEVEDAQTKKRVVIVGAGWGGLSAAQSLSSSGECTVTLIDASPRVGGVVRDGYTSVSGNRPAEAGQHGFWDNYHNIFSFLETGLPGVDIDEVLTGYAEQGQYSPRGLEAVWPVYRDAKPQLPTGLAQAFYTRFQNLPVADLITALPLVAAFNEFDDSVEAWERYDNVSFRDLCTRLGVSRRCYAEAFEPMILTGLFAPGAECSAAAALGMAYFFVLKSQNSFDVRWCRGNIGEKIFQPWVEDLERNGVEVLTSTRLAGLEMADTVAGKDQISKVKCNNNGEEIELEADAVVFAVGASALNGIVRNTPELSKHAEFRRYANLRGTSVLATRIYLDRTIDIPYSANACFGFDEGVGMTMFDISTLHGLDANGDDAEIGSVIEVDYYHASPLLVMDDDAIVAKVKSDLDTILGRPCVESKVADAAVVRLPQGVNWYFPGSYADMPSVDSDAIKNAYFAGDLVRSRHGSWSQEKAFVAGIEAANAVLGRPLVEGVIPLEPDEGHVALGRRAASFLKERGVPSLADFLW